MSMRNPTTDWERLGKENPLHGVLSDSRFDKLDLDPDAEEAFFQTGSVHVEHLLQLIEHCVGSRPSGRALDFGCGVGRVSLAMAQHFDAVVGVDVSAGMLEKAEQFRTARGIENVSYSDSRIPGALESPFDFVHTYIVLQHMKVSDGYVAIEQMVNALVAGGIGAVHLTYAYQTGTRIRNELKNAAKKLSLLTGTGNLLSGRRWTAPVMQMNNYDLANAFDIISRCNPGILHIVRVHDWENIGAFIIFQKERPMACSLPWHNPART